LVKSLLSFFGSKHSFGASKVITKLAFTLDAGLLGRQWEIARIFWDGLRREPV
jgi:hypothetical protein